MQKTHYFLQKKKNNTTSSLLNFEPDGFNKTDIFCKYIFLSDVF